MDRRSGTNHDCSSAIPIFKNALIQAAKAFLGKLLYMSKFPLLCTCLLLMASSVLSQDVQYNFDHTADFSKFKTYKWITLKSEEPIDKLTDEQIKATLDAAFSQKGLKKIDSDGSADLLIGYQSNEGVERRFAQLAGYSVGSGWSAITGDTSVIYQGQLAVDMYDPANHNLVWRGVASKTLDPKASPKKRQKNLNKAVAELMKNYPPPANK